MSSVLILGAAPLPFEKKQRQYAANLRTWHFTKPILSDGHRVRLIACRLPNTYSQKDDAEPWSVEQIGALEYISVREAVFENRSFLQQKMEEFSPDVIVGVNTYPASRAAALETDHPIWCDLNGWVMAEAQAKTHVYRDNRYLSHFWRMEKAVLERADMISTVSNAQAHAVIGELATLSRLGMETQGYPFVCTIPNAVVEEDYEHGTDVIRGKLAAESDFVVLWVGGYNTWTDVEMLFDGLAGAMAAIPELRFVSTGGAIDGHDEITFARFQEKIARSEFSDRVHFVGWVPTKDVPSYYFEADLGVNVDGLNFETVYGARNRLNEMMKVGLPILTTVGTEISQTLAERRLALVSPIGEGEAFAQKLIWAAGHRSEIAEMGRQAREFALQGYSYDRTTRSLRSWLQAPSRAPDLARKVALQDMVSPGDPAQGGETEQGPFRLGGELTSLERFWRRIRASLGR